MVWATAGGLGLIRPAPGTWGSIGAAVVVVPLAIWLPAVWLAPTFAGLALVALVLGFLVVPRAVGHFANEDPGQVVIDELAGVWTCYALIPWWLGPAVPVWGVLMAGLVAFRIFDIVKPFPVESLDAWGGTAGIMADDIAAGVLAALVVIPWVF